jgi:hypothetical protein
MAGRKSSKLASLWLYGIAALALMLTAPRLSAQTTASISGRVQDSTNAVVAGAKVTLINEATNDKADTDGIKFGPLPRPTMDNYG